MKIRETSFISILFIFLNGAIREILKKKCLSFKSSMVFKLAFNFDCTNMRQDYIGKAPLKIHISTISCYDFFNSGKNFQCL